MYSLNAPVPGRVSAIADDLFPQLSAFENVREDHSLLVKRLADDESYERVANVVRSTLVGAPAFEVAVTGIDVFDAPPTGTAPVVYLTVESPGLRQLHARLVDALGAVEHLEGDAYVPHVTLARDGPIDDARRLADCEIEPVTWTVTELHLADAHREHVLGTVSLPA